MFCQKCGKDNGEEAKFCKSCGAPLDPQEESPKNNSVSVENTAASVSDNQKSTSNNYDEKLLEAFIGKPNKVAYYASAFKKFETEGKKWNWSWWAAFCNLSFLFHRKVYLPAIIATVVLVALNVVGVLNPTNIFLLMLPTVLGIGIFVLLGGYGIKLVHNNFKKMKNEIASRVSNEDEQIQEMRKQGGFVAIWKLILAYTLFTAIYLGGVYYYSMAQIENAAQTEIAETSVQTEEAASPVTPIDPNAIGEEIAKSISEALLDEYNKPLSVKFERSTTEDSDGKTIDVLHVTTELINPSRGNTYTISYDLHLQTDSRGVLFGTIGESENTDLNGRMFVNSGEKGIAQEVKYGANDEVVNIQ